MIISTMNELPGYEIEEVFGLTVRSRNVGSQLGAFLKSLVGVGSIWTEICAYGTAVQALKV